ncbi:MAG: GreA/GreB family elongation factor [Deltaproteobacteria bacterium]|nr:GreA/GreB family elongation factor [Deltaproteobacteria bacterium]
MSPTAVSQYLADPDVRFDLCILDEASQMPPENALPSLARCRQALIVGDSRQLPPTSFFQKNPSGQDDEDGGAETVEESILELAQRAFRSTRSLLWHYRSRHSALIGYCNRVMYGDRLTVYPSPAETRADMGVGLVNVGGLYRQSINPAEAQAMVKAALDSMIADPDRSLGLVTFNQKQRDVIIEQMDRAIEADPRAIAYVERWRLENDGLETFFVKNLENVQGDERDIILIGTVFGPETPGGPVAQRFGPVSGEAGRRRLNVLFSRAKQKIVTFTSLAPSDITADREGLRGPSMLRGWLEYCAQGGQGAALSAQDDGQGPSLEAFVQERIQGLDYQADRLVGTEGYKLDLAVKSPPCHLGYLMGLEGDGPSYGRGVSARDRDRLRPEVLAGLGWKLRRIWSSGWLTDQEGETERLREALEGALAEAKGAPQRLPSCPAATRAGPAAAGLPGDAGPGAAQRDEVGSRARQAAIGDKVRIAFLDGDRETREVLITRSEDDPGLGLVSASSALGQALIDQEEEDEVQILVGSTVRNLIVESITKPDKPPTDASPEKTAADAAQGKAAPDRATPGTTPDRAGADAPQDGQATGTYKVPPYKFVLGAKGIQAVSQATPSPGRGPGPPPAPAGSAKSIQDLVQVKPEDLERFKDPDYQEALGELALGLIDGLGPLGLETISKALAKAHDLGRRSSGIDTIVQNAIGRKRAKSTGPDKQAIYWPLGLDPGKTIAFRGTVLNGLRRSLAEIAHPELLGLAKEVIGEHGPGQEGVQAMARRLEIGRITGGLRDRLNSLLAEARRLRS